jgi:COP9 signalosome complex subunit 3
VLTAVVIEQDNNFGLVKQCIDALKQRKIQRLTSTYLTLSLDDIAQNAGLSSAKEAEQSVLSMVRSCADARIILSTHTFCKIWQVESGKIFARINQQDGMVFFSEDTEGFDCDEVIQRFDSEIHHAIALSKRLEVIDQEVSLNQIYLNKTAARERSGGAAWNDLDVA